MSVRMREGDEGRVVFLHGMLGAPSSWAEVVEKLVGESSVDAAWLPGHGPEPWGTELTEFDAVVEAIEARILTSPAIVVGYSLGGRIALALAARRHPNLTHVVAIGANPGLDEDDARRARIAWERTMRDRLRDGGLEALVDAWERLPIFATQARLEARQLEAQRRVRRGHTRAGIDWAFDALGTGAMPSLVERLAAGHAPLSLVVGAHDHAYLERSRALATRLPRVALAVVDGAGHNVALEAPRALAAIVGERLRAANSTAQPA
jgi:2-succinyl-6-hydroxy-2,4-cyclohexadiene-1-carboxylate synthase